MVKENCIAFYLDRGYTLTPLKGKIPQVRKWQKTEYDPFFTTPDNFGVVLQDDDLVVDIDPRNGGVIPSFLSNANTLTIRTGGNGWHYYFKKDPSIAIVGLLKSLPGVEFKTKGNQVVGAGCSTTGEYVITNDAPAAQCTFLDLIKKNKEVLAQKTDKRIEWTNDAQTQDRFIKYLSNCPVAVQGQNGDATTFQVACHARDLGLDEITAVGLMLTHYNHRCTPPWPAEEINIKVNNAYKYAQNDAGTLSPVADFNVVESQDGVTGWERDKAGRTKPTFRNTLNALLMPNTEVSNLFRFNEFSEDIEFTKESPWHKSAKDSRNWTDADAVLLKEWISVHYSFAPDVMSIHEAVLAVAKRNSVHPVKNYLNSLKWDGVERVETWLRDYLGTEDNAYTRAVAELVLTAGVIRVFKPGTKFDYLMVLEGSQGLGKSRVCKTLGGQWHIECRLDPHNKDLIDYIRSKWVIEIPEMDASSRAETNAIKAFLSRDTDRCRLSYARTTKDFQRQCIFIGTYNPIDGESAYLKDPTGNRRFWPIKVASEQINIDKLAANRDQLWAEAIVISRAYAHDRLNWLGSEEALNIHTGMVAVRQEKDPWIEAIAPWCEHNIPKSVTAMAIFTNCLGGKYENYTINDGKRIASVMRAMGWEKKGVWDNTKQNSTPGYCRPELSDAEKRKKYSKMPKSALTNSDLSDIL
jgi:predicted P-loop ATPase